MQFRAMRLLLFSIFFPISLTKCIDLVKCAVQFMHLCLEKQKSSHERPIILKENFMFYQWLLKVL